MSALTEDDKAAIFAAAATATKWYRTSQGDHTFVDHGGFTWTVQLPPGEGKPYISGSRGWGGDTAEYIEATWAETFPIIDAAMDAFRVR
ncbi:hypothetical protein ACH4Q7_22655 [Streptomyces roseolus]|uniref:hypothetical protein n=1 Tax=Streptomyces roseolus TaxID=67358 RepID=UPI00378F1D64